MFNITICIIICYPTTTCFSCNGKSGNYSLFYNANLLLNVSDATASENGNSYSNYYIKI
jgi:hypothetical protein